MWRQRQGTRSRVSRSTALIPSGKRLGNDVNLLIWIRLITALEIMSRSRVARSARNRVSMPVSGRSRNGKQRSRLQNLKHHSRNRIQHRRNGKRIRRPVSIAKDTAVQCRRRISTYREMAAIAASHAVGNAQSVGNASGSVTAHS